MTSALGLTANALRLTRSAPLSDTFVDLPDPPPPPPPGPVGTLLIDNQADTIVTELGDYILLDTD